MSTFTGGALKLKGGAHAPGIKKKKKKKSLTKPELAAAEDEPGTSKALEEAVVMTNDAADSVPPPAEDRRTEAEKKAEAHAARHEEARIKKMAAKSHRERVAELNEKLATLTEHHDLFRISYTA